MAHVSCIPILRSTPNHKSLKHNTCIIKKLYWFRSVHLDREFEERAPSHCRKKGPLSDPRLFKSTFTLGLFHFWDHELFTILTTVPGWVPCETSTTKSQSFLASLVVKILSYPMDIQLGMSGFSWGSHLVGPKPMNFWRILWLVINFSLFSADAPISLPLHVTSSNMTTSHVLKVSRACSFQ